ncbi:MAG: heparinase II/III family protein [Candidatus Babeliales bacterium]
MESKLYRYAKKCWQLGPYNSFLVIQNRLKTAAFYYYIKHRAQQKKAHTQWHNLAKKYKHTSFFNFFQLLKTLPFKHLDDTYFFQVSENELSKISEETVHKSFDLLGSGLQKFEQMPWHADFRLTYKDSSAETYFDKDLFYQEIKIESGKTEKKVKDIKLPWELSRFQFLYALGKSYATTHEQKYADSFMYLIEDWLKENFYLLGPNWVCPMDVGIRAINLIYGFYFFKDAEIKDEFWQQFICSLYDHMIYLENNWEVYDSRTSNHYLSDLIGYFYLCYFFQSLQGIEQKTNWCYQEMLKEFDKQVFDEGSDYEGSTYYHKLVTEIFYLFSIIAQELGFQLSDSFHKKLKKMFIFLDWCTPYGGNLIQIGDNDSGKILLGIEQSLIDNMKNDRRLTTQHFPEFGLSIIKTPQWHISLRQHAYKKMQPSGHFHNDIGSITLAINGIDIFVDPGSYVYTPSAIWRNRFRSVNVHNTFYVEGIEPITLDEQLFCLDLPENNLEMHETENELNTVHNLYQLLGLQAHRKIIFDELQNSLIIFDQWEKSKAYQEKNLKSAWNFTLAPYISAQKQQSSWVLFYSRKPFAKFTANIDFSMQDGFYSSAYGHKENTQRLQAVKLFSFDEVVIKIELL